MGQSLPYSGAEKVQKTWCSQLHLVVNSCLENQQTDCCWSGKQSLFEEEGKTQHKMASKQQAIGQHFAKNCKQATAYTSHILNYAKLLSQ